MFGLFKKKIDKDKNIEDEDVFTEGSAQKGEHGIYRGMYCSACGYMEVNENSNALPLEGFAICPNCGALLSAGYFAMDKDGTFSLRENPPVFPDEKKPAKRVIGGHYRVRKPGPSRGHFHGHFC